MNWVFVLLAGTAVLAGPVVAGVVAPSLVTQVAERGLAVNHRHFVFNEQFPVQHGDREYVVQLFDADLYEMPLTAQVVVRGAVLPAPSDEELRTALDRVAARYHLPVLAYDVERRGEDVVLKATLPAGVLANASPKYRALVEKYAA